MQGSRENEIEDVHKRLLPRGGKKSFHSDIQEMTPEK